MDRIEQFLRTLPERHRAALHWFAERAGEQHPWPLPIETDNEHTLLASKAKGIYKPKWSEYALSVRQTRGGPYPDRDPVMRADGTWSFAYFQENENPAARDDEFTNRGLVACQRDRVPVGVMRQISNRSNVRYHVLGVALVAGWEAGYFFLEGFSPDGACRRPGPGTQMDILVYHWETGDDATGMFESHDMKEARERVVASIVRRRGQGAFRTALLGAYGGRCALTGCPVTEVLEAAHITPYRGVDTNNATNGLLLRSDIHVLFDLGLIGIDPETKRVVVGAGLSGTVYDQLGGQQIAEPNDEALSPSPAALAEHFQWSQLENTEDE